MKPQLDNTFWDSLNPESKAKWKRLAVQMGLLDFNPTQSHRDLETKGEMEGIEEISEIMRTVPGFNKDEEE